MSENVEKSAYGLGRGARLNLTHQILNELADSQRPLDAILSGHFRHLESQLERRDRRDLETRIRSVLLSYRRLLWWLNKVRLAPSTRTMVLADLILNDNANIAMLEKLCSGGKNRMSMLTREEIASLKGLLDQKIDHEDMPSAVAAECPDWAEDGLKRVFGDRFKEGLRALGNKPSSDYRINVRHADRETVKESLASQGFKTENCALSPIGLRQSQAGGPVLSETDAFRQGWVEVQDEGSQLVALLADAQPGMQVADFCAGAGGKTLAMAAQMKNKGHLVATDVHSKRLQRAKQRLKRAGIENTQCRTLEHTFDKWVKKSREKFDRVLVDAPCTGTGTWRRNPDSKWSKDQTDLDELVKLQYEILQSSSRLVKKGGRLIYATCSLLPEENEDQVEAFLKGHPNFRRLDPKDIWAQITDVPYPSQHERYFRLTPLDNDCDGFFACVFERTKDN